VLNRLVYRCEEKIILANEIAAFDDLNLFSYLQEPSVIPPPGLCIGIPFMYIIFREIFGCGRVWMDPFHFFGGYVCISKWPLIN
jgi:hypothetical protein